jgi:hypothetical protein
MTDFLIIARSEIWVESPMMVSVDICAFWSISDRFFGSVGREYVTLDSSCFHKKKNEGD